MRQTGERDKRNPSVRSDLLAESEVAILATEHSPTPPKAQKSANYDIRAVKENSRPQDNKGVHHTLNSTDTAIPFMQ